MTDLREARVQLTPFILEFALGCSQSAARLYAAALDEACLAYAIDTPDRLAHFLSQVAHESGALAYVREIWGPTPAQQRYEGRADLGNTQPGDGRRYCGRGLLHTTGRANYRSLTERLRARGIECPDFEATPEALELPRWAALSAADYWDMRSINRLADVGDFEGVTRAVNGGINGIEDRRRRLERAAAVLNATVNEYREEEPAVHLGPEPTPAPEPQPETSMVAPAVAIAGSFLWELAKSAISAFAPLAQEKITKEIGRHTDKPEIAGQVGKAIIDTAMAVTGLQDPLAAVVAAKASPAAIQQMELSALQTIDQLMPVLERVQAWDQAAWAAEEASRIAADERARAAEKDQDEFLTRSIVGLLAGVLVGGSVLAVVLAMYDVDVQTIVGALILLVGTVGGKFGTRYDHRYGSSRGSAAKDAINAELARRPRAAS